MHIMLKNTELLKHSKITLQHVSVYAETIFSGSEKVSTLFDARCHHEVYLNGCFFVGPNEMLPAAFQFSRDVYEFGCKHFV